MARVLEKKLSSAAGAGDTPDTTEDEEGQDLWSSILSEVSTRSRSKLPSGKNILVFGEHGSGKTTIMAKLQGTEHVKKGKGLEYLYLSVHDEDRDDLTRCNVWTLDGDLYHKGLLKFAVSASSLRDSLAVLVADMSRPWSIMESLRKWANVLRDHVDKLCIPLEEMRHMEHEIVKDFQEYTEPEDDIQGSPQRRGCGSEDEGGLLPLGDNVLTHNLGIPVLVVCTKCDAISILEKEHDYREEHFDFIQFHIRRFCLQYGAGLIYTSAKEEKNLDLLYKYIVHKLYEFELCTPALVVEKDSVFIPAGWDNDKKIAILHENFTTVKVEDLFEDFIVKPPVRKLVADKEVIAEDEQVFLMKQQSLLAKQPATPTRATESPARTGTGSPRPAARPGQANVASISPMTAVKKPDPSMKGAAANEGVLANFFNSLLSKKTGSPGSPGAAAAGGGGGGGGTIAGPAKKAGQKLGLTDVEVKLDRMTHKPDSMATGNNSPTENKP